MNASLKVTALAAMAALPILRPPAMHAAPVDADAVGKWTSRHQDAIVEVRGTLTLKMELIDGPEEIAAMLAEAPEESTAIEAFGVMIHGQGIVAMPVAMLDPTMLMGKLTLPTPAGPLTIGMKSTISDLKILTADGAEHAADVSLKEAAAGLALLRIREAPGEPMTAVPMDPEQPAPEPFVRICLLTRLGTEFGRTANVRVARITTSTPPPMPLHGIDATQPGDVGAAAFDTTGRFLGLVVLPCRGESMLETAASLDLFVLPQCEILRLGAAVIP